MRRATLISLAFLLAAAAVPWFQVHSTPQAADRAQSETLIARTYSIGDLPVWSKNGDLFDPSILMALLQESLGAEGWQREDRRYEALAGTDGKSCITVFAPNQSLVVNAAEPKHVEIQRLLSRLRTRP